MSSGVEQTVLEKGSAISPLAGHPAPPEMLVDVSSLEREYFRHRPDPDNPAERVAFGTSGHRGSSLQGSFTEAHVLAITQAICEYRRAQRIEGPLFLARDTHALSAPALHTTLEVLAANGVETLMQKEDQVLPTPVVSHAILAYNRGRMQLADGIIVTSSHNPPEDGGLKYNPPHGGPAGAQITRGIQLRANELLARRNAGVRRTSPSAAWRARTTHRQEILLPYVKDLRNVVDMDVIRQGHVSLGVDPLGGAAVRCWGTLAAHYELDIEVVDASLDPCFGFMTVDRDGAIRMDCSSPYATARLVERKDRYRVACANDPDADRHGIVTPSAGLLSPNHYLAVAVHYLLTQRPDWPGRAVVGKSLVSSSMIDRVVRNLGGQLYEVPVGFKWFVPRLLDGSCCFAGEESACASFVRRDGSVWTTEKDGLIMGLLAAEITARTGRDPGELYRELEDRLGATWYTRIDAVATPAARARLARLSATSVEAASVAGEPIHAKLTKAPGNGSPIDGVKVVASSGWFAARASGTENTYRIYAESFRGPGHLSSLVNEAHEIVSAALSVQR